MYKIVKKKSLNPTVTLMEIDAPLIAKKAQPGQFIILRVDEDGERIPLTVAGYDREKGTVRIIFQIVGATTEKLNHLNEGDCLHDFVGERFAVSFHFRVVESSSDKALDGEKRIIRIRDGLTLREKSHESLTGF